MTKSRLIAAGIAMLAAGTIAYGAGNYENLPIVGGSSFCTGTVTGAGAPFAGATGQGQGTTSSICAQTVPAGPPALTGNELVPADVPNGGSVTSVTIPSGLLTAGAGMGDDTNALIGTDFGQALWQRGTTPLNAATPTTAAMGADGWYNIELGSSFETITVSKQTGAADVPSNSLASARVQRVASQTLTAQVCTGQLVPDADATQFPGKTAIFSVDMLAGANFSPTASLVNMVIAYHSAADVTTPSANGQGTNTATFASSTGVPLVQNISNYTEAINTPTPITTTWTRYSVAAAIPTAVPGTTTAVLGIGVKLCWTPTGTAGTNDFLEFAKAQLEARVGSSVGPAKYVHNTLAAEYALETSRYWQISENGSAGTPLYANANVGATNQVNILFNFPSFMRITPTTSPITIGGFKLLIAGTATTPGTLVTTGVSNTQRTGALSSQTTATAGQSSLFVGSGAGTGVIGFSAEP